MKHVHKIIAFVSIVLFCQSIPLFGMEQSPKPASWSSWLQRFLGQETESSIAAKKDLFCQYLEQYDYSNAYVLLTKSQNPNVFSELIIQYLPTLAQSHEGKKIILEIINVDISCHTALAQKIAGCVCDLPTQLLVEVAQKITNSSAIDTAMTELARCGRGRDLFKALQYEMHLRKNLKLALTPTGVHLRKNIWALHDSLLKKYQNEPELLDMLDDIIAKEREMNASGHYTFLHAQRRGFYLPEKIYTALWEVKQNKPTQNFLFAHVKEITMTAAQQIEEYNVRKLLCAYGRIPKDNYTRQKLLFLNYALFANMRDPGSNSAYYLAHNINWGSVRISVGVNDAFTLLGYESLYETFKDELQALSDEYVKGRFGNMLLVSVPRKTASKYVYLCEAGKGLTGRGGVRRKIEIQGFGLTDNINIIMHTLMHYPERIANTDDLEFALIMTSSKGGLDPETGIKIHPLVSGDKNRLNDLQQKEDALIARIQQAAREYETKLVALKNAQIRAGLLARHIVS